MSPAHHVREHRGRIIVLVVAVVAGVGILSTVSGSPAPTTPATSSAQVAVPGAESSAWYCTGQSGAQGKAPGSLVLTNSTTQRVTASLTAVTDRGASAHATVAIPARDAVVWTAPSAPSGSWEAQTVVVNGGGVAVTQVVHDALGWSQAPCLSTTSSHWYFPSGSTAAANGLWVAVLNPTSTPVVVDLAFVTPTGTVHPINFQGIVLAPGQLVVENVASVVQQVSTVSTVVSTRTGRVAASIVQQNVGGSPGDGGLSLLAGVASPQSSWSIPAAREASGGTSEIDVFNPGSTPASVTVRLHLPSGPLAPLSNQVAPGTTWVLDTGAQTRIPRGETYSVTVTAAGDGRIVVGRAVALPGSASPPQAGTALAVDGVTSTSPVGEWVVPPPGTRADLPVSGAARTSLALLNVSGAPVDYRAVAVRGPGSTVRTIAAGTLAAGATALVSGAPLASAGLDQIVVRATGPTAVSVDASPSGGIGVVTMAGIALGAPVAGP